MIYNPNYPIFPSGKIIYTETENSGIIVQSSGSPFYLYNNVSTIMPNISGISFQQSSGVFNSNGLSGVFSNSYQSRVSGIVDFTSLGSYQYNYSPDTSGIKPGKKL